MINQPKRLFIVEQILLVCILGKRTENSMENMYTDVWVWRVKLSSSIDNLLFFLFTAVMYCSLEALISKVRGGEEDEFNSIGAATLAGMIFKSTAGLRPIAIAGAVGGSLAAGYHFGQKLLTSRGHTISTPNWA